MGFKDPQSAEPAPLSIVEIQGIDLPHGDSYSMPCASLEDARAIVRIQLKSDSQCFAYCEDRKQLWCKEKSQIQSYNPNANITMFFFGKVLEDASSESEPAQEEAKTSQEPGVTNTGAAKQSEWDCLNASHYGVEMENMEKLDLKRSYLWTTKEYKLPV